MKDIMKKTALALALGMLVTTTSAHALTVLYDSDGPLMSGDWLAKFVGPKLSGSVAAIPNIEKGGKYRLVVRANSKYFSKDNSYLYLVEFDFQRSVIDSGVHKTYWATINNATSWGSVPSEKELGGNIAELIANKVNTWQPE